MLWVLAGYSDVDISVNARLGVNPGPCITDSFAPNLALRPHFAAAVLACDAAAHKTEDGLHYVTEVAVQLGPEVQVRFRPLPDYMVSDTPRFASPLVAFSRALARAVSCCLLSLALLLVLLLPLRSWASCVRRSPGLR